MIARIYCIKSPQTEEVYVGSTVNELVVRMYNHKKDYKRYLNDLHPYMTSFDIVKYPDAYIELLEERTFETKEDRYICERKWIQEIKSCNKYMPYKSPEEKSAWCQEYRDTHIEERVAYDKIYREKNKDRIKQQKFEKHICECGGKYITQNKSRHMNTPKHIDFIHHRLQTP